MDPCCGFHPPHLQLSPLLKFTLTDANSNPTLSGPRYKPRLLPYPFSVPLPTLNPNPILMVQILHLT